MSKEETTDLLALAKQVLDFTSSIVSHLESLDHPQPNFSISSTLVPKDEKYEGLRNKLNDVATDLLALVNGPHTQARKQTCQVHDLAAHQVAFHFDFFEVIPENGSAHLREISRKTGVDQDRAGRILRILCTQRIFKEVQKDTFAHTAYSVTIRRDEEMKASGAYMLDENFKADSEASLSIKDGAKTPFEQRHGMSVFEFYAKNPDKAARFAKAMAGITRLDRQMTELKSGFTWRNLGQNAKVVDIGGGSGHIGVALAREFPNLNVTVQDNNLDMLNTAKDQDLTGVEKRMTFMQYDFFTPQPIIDADVYFFRQVLHNWDDESCVKMLKVVAKALENSKPGTALLINETIQIEAGSASRFEEHLARQVDMLLLVTFGAKHRTKADFDMLLGRADSRLRIVNVYSQGSMGLLEVHLDSDP
ncbi:sterigmatocystin 8-O-methyltransferase precursor [Dendryphion nanum]|uniref:Sterigmatocystin 8-O-methyltransferase n=1 Tax=Dendryphion nanum TaxID=256645 RepID=A0A9P9ECR5_9PLEO|nr:sterigmatocystin 8-O-methyltransferase precursor [Dendryphion nanum]